MTLARSGLDPAQRHSGHGTLAGLPALSLGVEGISEQQKTSCEQEVMQIAVVMVAGGRIDLDRTSGHFRRQKLHPHCKRL